MKKIVLGIAIGAAIGALGTYLIQNSSSVSAPEAAVQADDIVSNVSIAPLEIDFLDDDHIVRVENYGISVEDFTNAFEMVKQNLPPEQQAALLANESMAKAEILETMINQYAVIATALEEGFLENPDNLKMFRNAAQQALFNLYISQNMPQSGFQASKPEIDQAFSQYGSELRARGMNASQIQEFLASQIAQQKQQRWMIEFVSKIKEAYRVERNHDIIRNLDISTTVSPLLQP